MVKKIIKKTNQLDELGNRTSKATQSKLFKDLFFRRKYKPAAKQLAERLGEYGDSQDIDTIDKELEELLEDNLKSFEFSPLGQRVKKHYKGLEQKDEFDVEDFLAHCAHPKKE